MIRCAALGCKIYRRVAFFESDGYNTGGHKHRRQKIYYLSIDVLLHFYLLMSNDWCEAAPFDVFKGKSKMPIDVVTPAVQGWSLELGRVAL